MGVVRASFTADASSVGLYEALTVSNTRNHAWDWPRERTRTR